MRDDTDHTNLPRTGLPTRQQLHGGVRRQLSRRHTVGTVLKALAFALIIVALLYGAAWLLLHGMHLGSRLLSAPQTLQQIQLHNRGMS